MLPDSMATMGAPNHWPVYAQRAIRIIKTRKRAIKTSLSNDIFVLSLRQNLKNFTLNFFGIDLKSISYHISFNVFFLEIVFFVVDPHIGHIFIFSLNFLPHP